MGIFDPDLLTFVLSFAILWAGGHLLVQGAVGIGKSFGLGSFFVGFTLVALGTSVPELLVCFAAAFMGSSDIAVGNMIGSNIANIGFILGLTVLLNPVTITAEAWKEQKPALFLLLFLTFLASGLSRTGFSIERWEGALLVVPLAVFLFFSRGKSEKQEGGTSADGHKETPAKLLLYVVFGSLLLAAGAHLLVEKAIALAASLGISELFVGAAVVALGTSLPELAASLAAAWKGHQSVVVGNIIGSNFFNLAFLGLVAAVSPVDVNPHMFGTKPEFGFLLGLTVLLALFVMKTRVAKNRIGRGKGVLVLALYAAFVYLISGSLS